jgi:hypothetical protein
MLDINSHVSLDFLYPSLIFLRPWFCYKRARGNEAETGEPDQGPRRTAMLSYEGVLYICQTL